MAPALPVQARHAELELQAQQRHASQRWHLARRQAAALQRRDALAALRTQVRCRLPARGLRIARLPFSTGLLHDVRSQARRERVEAHQRRVEELRMERLRADLLSLQHRDRVREAAAHETALRHAFLEVRPEALRCCDAWAGRSAERAANGGRRARLLRAGAGRGEAAAGGAAEGGARDAGDRAAGLHRHAAVSGRTPGGAAPHARLAAASALIDEDDGHACLPLRTPCRHAESRYAAVLRLAEGLAAHERQQRVRAQADARDAQRQERAESAWLARQRVSDVLSRLAAEERAAHARGRPEDTTDLIAALRRVVAS